MIKKQKWLLQLTAVIFVTVMVLAAEGLGEREILFPEIAALAVGALAAPRQSWQTNRVRMVASIAVCATGGVLIVRLVPWPLWGQMLLAFAICQGMYLFSRTTFAPMISAMVLPVLLGTTSWVYPIAAVVLTAGIAGLQFLFEKVGIREKLPFSPLPLPGRQDILDTLLRILCAGAVIFAAVLTGWRMCAAPPLLVAFTEFSRCGSRARSTPLRTIFLVSLCGCCGALCRWLVSAVAGLPLALAAAAAMSATLLLMWKMKQYLPPAGAMAILPMLLPVEQVKLFGIQVFIGVSIFMGLALLLFRNKRESATTT